jgi:hypothetical protein
MTAFSDRISQLTWENQPRNTMALANIITGQSIRPPRVLLMGTPGIGKTTFCSQAPKPIFLQTEDGADVLGAARFPLATSFAAVMADLTTLATEPHDYQTVVIDSLDPLEVLIHAQVNSEHTEKDLAYGKGVLFANDKWREVLDALTYLRDEKHMISILVAHTQIKRFDNPETDSYDRYIPRLNEKTAGIISAWADAHLFAAYKIFTKETEVGFNKDVRRGVGAGERVLYTSERPAYLAKNRYNLPHELPMNWQAFSDAVAKSATAPKQQTAQAAN